MEHRPGGRGRLFGPEPGRQVPKRGDIDHRPAWVQDAVFYQIFPDRFARSERVPKPGRLEEWDSPPTRHGYKGGDLLGIVEHLDWIAGLGATALYLNPIFQSASNHRYHTHDYLQVDPILGGNEAFAEMLAACHARGIRVVLDGVFNHASRGFYYFNDILENGVGSAWLDWFIIEDLPLNAYQRDEPPNYAAWWGDHALPKLNTENPVVREYLMGVAEHWTRAGIDGWRLDVPADIETEGFWEEMRRRVRAINPDIYLVGEIWDDATEWVVDGTRFDGVMNYPITEAIIRFAAHGNIDEAIVEPVNLTLTPPLDAAGYGAAVDAHLQRYPWEAHLCNLNLLGSHDTARVRSMMAGDEASVRLAVVLMLTFPGTPSIYYADEIGMNGAHDPGSRAGFPWERPGEWDSGLLEVYRSLIALRHAEAALRSGAYRRLAADGGLYAFSREDAGGGVVIAVNAGPEEGTAGLGCPVGELLWGEGNARDGIVTVPARSAAIWRADS
ncbi:MAG: glycoside hydrolase family 13 protein [Actinobacteria bacterium]|nr:glycoside hydrolase family 13 protein [Actinomycetota bacterium]